MAREKGTARHSVTPPVHSKAAAIASATEARSKQLSMPIDKADPQTACPFFHGKLHLPQEIRSMIFEFALTSYEDSAQPRRLCDYEHEGYPEADENMKYRPGHFCHRRIDTALLFTCRRIYMETCQLPVTINTHVLWYRHVYMGSSPNARTARDYFKLMTQEQLLSVQDLHIFAEEGRLRAHRSGTYSNNTIFNELCSMRDPSTGGGLFPQKLTITIPWKDWRDGRSNMHFSLRETMLTNRNWENVFSGLRLLRMELECLTEDKHLWNPVLEALLEYKYNIGNGEVLAAQSKVHENTWKEKMRIERHIPGGALWDREMVWVDAEFYVVTVTWRV